MFNRKEDCGKEEKSSSSQTKSSSIDYDEAIKYIDQEEYEKSCAIFENIIEIEPHNKEVQKKLIEIYSILLKKYAQEKKSDLVDQLFEKLDDIRNITRRNL